MKNVDMTIKQYDDLLSSSSPTPGGGSALAHVGAKACALVEMACNVTIAKYDKKGIECRALKDTLPTLKTMREEFYTLAERDAQAFEQVICAMRLPKTNDDEISARQTALQKAYEVGASVPLCLIELCSKCTLLAQSVIENADKFVVSDAVIGMDLLKVVATNSMHNLTANTNCMEEQKAKTYLDKAKSFIEQLQ